MRWRALLAALGIGGLALSGRKAAPPQRAIRSVVALGDSHTASGAYLRQIHAQLGTSGGAVGLTGHGVASIAERLPGILAQRPDVVVIQAGVNDIASGRSAQHVVEGLGRMYAQVRAAGVHVVAVPVMPWGRYQQQPRFNGRRQALADDTWAVNAWIGRQPVAQVDVAWLGDGWGNLRSEYDSGDGLHLNARGQAALGDWIARVIQ